MVCGTASIMFIQSAEAPQQRSARAAGWVLAQKYGGDVQKLMSIYQITPDNEKKEIMIGYGWGLTAEILDGKTINDSISLQKLELLLNEIPDAIDLLARRGPRL